MRGYAVSDYANDRYYMNPQQGVLNGNDLPDGTTSGWSNQKDYDGNAVLFTAYDQENGNYGELAWAMREAAHNILYTVVNSNAMNGIDGDFSTKSVTPAWKIAMPIMTRVALTIFIWCALAFVVVYVIDVAKDCSEKKNCKQSADKDKK